MKKHTFINNPSRKELSVQLVGMLSAREAQEFVMEYKKILSTINPTETVFTLDCTKMILTPKNIVTELKDCFAMYRDDRFKKIIFKVSKDRGSLIKAEFIKLGKLVSLNNMEVID